MDFIYQGGYCSSRGCPECHFDNQLFFDTDYERTAFRKAKAIVKDHIESGIGGVSAMSPLLYESEVSEFLENVRQQIPAGNPAFTIYSCKHGNILYNRIVRFSDVSDLGVLEESIRCTLPQVSLERLDKDRVPLVNFFRKVGN